MASQVPRCAPPPPTSVSTILCIFLPPSHVWSNDGVQVSSTHRVCGKTKQKKKQLPRQSFFAVCNKSLLRVVAAEMPSVTCVAVVWSLRLKSSHRSFRTSHHPPWKLVLFLRILSFSSHFHGIAFLVVFFVFVVAWWGPDFGMAAAVCWKLKAVRQCPRRLLCKWLSAFHACSTLEKKERLWACVSVLFLLRVCVFQRLVSIRTKKKDKCCLQLRLSWAYKMTTV